MTTPIKENYFSGPFLNNPNVKRTDEQIQFLAKIKKILFKNEPVNEIKFDGPFFNNPNVKCTDEQIQLLEKIKKILFKNEHVNLE